MLLIIKCFVLVCFLMHLGPISAQVTVKSIDEALINHERIAHWLDKPNRVSAASSVNNHINNFRLKNNRNLSQVINYQAPTKRNYSINKLAVSNQKYSLQRVAPIEKKTSVKVLAILIDFPDLAYNQNQLTTEDTDHFYEQYSALHYDNLLFSPTGFEGPNGQNLMSVNQYFNQESGDSFNFSGDVLGWYQAKHRAAYYGENNETNDINTVDLVIEAIENAVSNTQINLSDYDNKDPRDIDNDLNFDEPDGEIDHVLIFHSSIGEESGGGTLGTDAIWSHRFAVPIEQSPIRDTEIKVGSYTIHPIDATVGVIVHEFGHDLGLIDEYDLNSTKIGAPVGYWSVMAHGNWLGDIRGTKPTGFSPLAREHLQNTFGGNWINQQTIKADDLLSNPHILSLTQSNNHNHAFNQIKIELPPKQEYFGVPQQGNYQLLASHEDNSNFSFQKTISIPNDDNVQLVIWAKWDIEKDFDYAQILINGDSLSNEYTSVGKGKLNEKDHVITGSLLRTPWVRLKFDISKFKNESVALEINYVTDQAIGGFGLTIDNISLDVNDNTIGIEDFEEDFVDDKITINKNQFTRINAFRSVSNDYYYLQLRSHNKLDEGLKATNYEPGILLWYRNDNFADNNSSLHAGSGFLSVIDADQSLISEGITRHQIRDAAFSLYPQQAYQGDEHLSPVNSFSDLVDYSATAQPQSGTILPLWGINFSVLSQDISNQEASLLLTRDEINLNSEIQEVATGLKVSFSHKSLSSYKITDLLWDFGDGTLSNVEHPIHEYSNDGDYKVSVIVSDNSGDKVTVNKNITIKEDVTETQENVSSPMMITNESNGNAQSGGTIFWLLLLCLWEVLQKSSFKSFNEFVKPSI